MAAYSPAPQTDQPRCGAMDVALAAERSPERAPGRQGAAGEARAGFPPLVLAVGGFAFGTLAILAVTWGFRPTPRLFGGLAVIAAMTGVPFVVYRNFRNEQRVAYAFGALGLIMGVSYVNACLALVSMASPIPLQDPWLMRSSAAIGFDYRALLEWIAERPPLGKLLELAYLSSGPMTFVAPLILAWTRQDRRLRRFVTLYALLLTLCVSISILLPSEGYALYAPLPPELVQRLPPGAATFYGGVAEAYRSGTLRVLDPSHFDGVVVFPSFHTAMALLTAYALWKTPVLRVAAAALCGAVLLSVVPIGGHYIWDVVAAVVLFAVALPIVQHCESRSLADLSSRRRAPSSALQQRAFL
jgi:hypothetical protein